MWIALTVIAALTFGLSYLPHTKYRYKNARKRIHGYIPVGIVCAVITSIVTGIAGAIATDASANKYPLLTREEIGFVFTLNEEDPAEVIRFVRAQKYHNGKLPESESERYNLWRQSSNEAAFFNRTKTTTSNRLTAAYKSCVSG